MRNRSSEVQTSPIGWVGSRIPTSSAGPASRERHLGAQLVGGDPERHSGTPDVEILPLQQLADAWGEQTASGVAAGVHVPIGARQSAGGNVYRVGAREHDHTHDGVVATALEFVGQEESGRGSNREKAATVRTRCLPGSSAQLERFDPTTENRGVPGSSPGLAIAKLRMAGGFPVFPEHAP